MLGLRPASEEFVTPTPKDRDSITKLGYTPFS